MLSDLDLHPDKKKWAYVVRDLLSNLGFYDVWLNQGVGNIQLNKELLIFLFKIGWKD